MIDEKWDMRFLELARFIAQWSKDPSTKTGAVIVDANRRIISTGYNGFARGVEDRKEDYANRAIKYRKILHCERNAIIFAKRDLSGCCLYTWPFLSCSACAGMVIQSGIVRCVTPPLPPELQERWGDDIATAMEMFREAGVAVRLVELI